MDQTPRGVLSKRPRIAGSTSSSSGNGSFSRTTTPKMDINGSNVENSNRRFNPFERHLIERLHLPVYSPSTMIGQVQTPPKMDWSINQISILNPSNIEDSPSTHQFSENYSEEMEQSLQSKITSFFDNHHLPSPVPLQSTPAKSGKKIMVDKCVGTDITLPRDIPGHILELLASLSMACDLETGMPAAPETLGLVSRGRGGIDDVEEAHHLLTNTSFLRRKLEFSFDHTDESVRSEESDTEVHTIHGALILSP